MSDTSTEDVTARATRDLLQDFPTRSAHSHCLLLLDPSLRPLDAEDAFWPHHADRPRHSVPLAHRNVDPTHYPVLATLESKIDVSLLTRSVREACIELTSQSLQQGNGRRISGWLVSGAPTEDVALHLGKIMVQRHPSGRHVWLRLQDPAVFWLVWGWLQPAQRAALLGPIERFYLLNPIGQLLRLVADEQAINPDLGLNSAQWAAIDCIEPLNAALRDWDGLRYRDNLRDARSTALAAIQRAKKLGFDDASDLAFYGLCALTVHARFDFHGLVIERLRARRPGDYFGGLVADLEPRDWQRIAKEVSPSEPTP